MFRTFIRNISVSAVQYKTIRTPTPVYGIEGRYVQALYSAASQKNELDGVEKHLKDFLKELEKPTVKDFIGTSMIMRSAKAKLLIDVGNAVGMPSTASNFLGLVAENGRLKLLKKIITMFLTVMAAHKKEIECEVITATPLESRDREALMTVLQKFVKGGRKIHLIEKVDSEIIGGVIIGIEDKHIDLCIFRKIMLYTKLLKQTL